MPQQGHLPHRASVSGCGILSHRYPCRHFGFLLKWRIRLTKICLKFLPILSPTNIGKWLEIPAFHYELPPKTALGCKNPEGKLANRGLEMPACGIGKHGMMRHPAESPSSSIEGFYKPYTGMPPGLGATDTSSTWLHSGPPFAKTDLKAKSSAIGGSTYLPSNKGKSSLVEAWNASERPYHDYTLNNTRRLAPNTRWTCASTSTVSSGNGGWHSTSAQEASPEPWPCDGILMEGIQVFKYSVFSYSVVFSEKWGILLTLLS